MVGFVLARATPFRETTVIVDAGGCRLVTDIVDAGGPHFIHLLLYLCDAFRLEV